MPKELRKSGLNLIGNVPWPTHFCQFYETQEDLLDVLVPYFKTGLENNELCVWVTSDFLTKETALKAMQKAMPNFSQYLQAGQMEIFPYTEWYLKEDKFELQRVLSQWVEKHSQALDKGYAGLRVSGNPFWINNKKDWDDFTAYEAEINKVIGPYKMLVLCTYSILKCGANEVIDVVNNHEYAMIKRQGKWELIKSIDDKNNEEKLKKINSVLKTITDSNHATIHAKNEQECLDNICRIIADDCGYPFVWIGFAKNDAKKTVKPIAYAGFNDEYINQLDVSWADTKQGNGPTGTAIRTGRISQCKNMLADPNFSPWKEKALKYGYASSLAIPLKTGENPAFGAINIYSQIPDGFSGEEIALLSELADDLAYSIISLRTQEKLQEQALMLANANDAVVGFDLNSKITFWNKTAERIYEYTAEEATGKTAINLFKTIFIGLTHDELKKKLRGEGTIEFESIRYTKNNKKKYIETHAIALRNYAGEITGFVSVDRDVTERKQTEQELKEGQERFRSAFEDSAVAAIMTSTDTTLLKANSAFCRLLGFAENEILGHSFYEFTHPADITNDIIELEAVLKGKKPSLRIEKRYMHKNGSTIWCDVSLATVRDEQGKIIYLIGNAQDITQQKETEKRLKNYAHKIETEKAKDEALLSSIGHGIVATDTEGKMLFANNMIEQFLNKKYDSLEGKNLIDIINLYDVKDKPLKLSSRPLLMAIRRKGPFSKNYYCLGRNKKKIYINITMAPIFLHGKMLGTVGVYRDITKEKETEKAKTEFVSLASHQLRTPITEISLSAEMLLSGMAGKIKKGQRKYLTNIQDGVKEITSLVETLLNISRIEMGTFIINPRPVNITSFTDNLIENFSMQIKSKRLALKKHYSRMPLMNVDPNIYKLIFDNLFSNAIKYTERGHIGVDISKNGNNAIIKVFDTGCGIPENQHHLVFGKLFRTENSLKSKTKGYGLGLYIIKSIIEKIGGRIRFESKEGSGTAFYVSMPIKGMKKRVQPSLL